VRAIFPITGDDDEPAFPTQHLPISRHHKATDPTRALAWLLNLATRMLACSLNMPEPLAHNTGVFVFVRVQAAENSIGKSLCSIRLLRQFRNWRRSSAR